MWLDAQVDRVFPSGVPETGLFRPLAASQAAFEAACGAPGPVIRACDGESIVLPCSCLASRPSWIMSTRSEKLLLSIVELGGYPNFAPLYKALGYTTVVENRMRKAIGFLKRRQPAVIVAEFNFQSDFRDRTSSLESLLAVVQRMPDTRVLVLYDREYQPQFEQLRSRLPVHAALAFPVTEEPLREALLGIGRDANIDASTDA